MINLIKETDPESLPIFVARDLQKLPPVTFDHVDVTRLLKDIIIIQKELRDIQNKCESETEKQSRYVTVEDFELLKKEVQSLSRSQNSEVSKNMPFVNTKRGASCLHDSFRLNSGHCTADNFSYNSGPMGMFPITSTSISMPTSPEGTLGKGITVDQLAKRTSQQTYASTVKTYERRGTLNGDTAASVNTVGVSLLSKEADTPVATTRARTEVTSPLPISTRNSDDRQVLMSNSQQNLHLMQECSKSDINFGDEWKLVQPKKTKKNKFVGKKGKAVMEGNCKFRAAEAIIPIYIYNVNREVCPQDISEYIAAKTHIQVNPIKVSVPDDKNYDAYRMEIPRKKLPVFDNDSLWPQDIFFKRYYIFKNKICKENADTKQPSGCQPLQLING